MAPAQSKAPASRLHFGWVWVSVRDTLLVALTPKAPPTKASSFKNLDVEAQIKDALAKTGLGCNLYWSNVC